MHVFFLLNSHICIRKQFLFEYTVRELIKTAYFPATIVHEQVMIAALMTKDRITQRSCLGVEVQKSRLN